MKFKIRKANGAKYNAEYLGKEKKFSFNNQSSEPKQEFILYPGTNIDMEFDAIRERPEPGEIVDLEGVFYNFTKKNPPEMVFCVTKVNL